MILYHGTAAALLPEIMARGLLPRAGKGADAWARVHAPALAANLDAETSGNEERQKAIYATPDIHVARWYAQMAAEINKSRPAILAFDTPSRDAHWDTGGDARGYRILKPVSAKDIHVMPPELLDAMMPDPLPYGYDPNLRSL